MFHNFFGIFAGINPRHKPIYATMENCAISFLEVDDDENRYIRYWNERSHVIDLLG